MEDGDTEKYRQSSVIQDFVFLSLKRSSIRCISLQVYNTNWNRLKTVQLSTIVNSIVEKKICVKKMWQ